jgi:hypothetical protein
MNHNEFWEIIDKAREEADGWEDMWDPLVNRLSALDIPDIMLWQRIFGEYQRLSYKNKLWAAAYIINGGCSDDGFDYFRGWLTAQGRTVFLNALKDPESLAEVDSCEEGVEFEYILGAAATAYFRKTGASRDYDAFDAELGRHPLPDEAKAAMAAEIGNDTVIRAFQRFDAARPPWLEKLHWSAAEYLMCGDRTSDGADKPVSLSFEPCHEFVDKSEVNKPAAWIGGALPEHCEHCGCALVNLLLIDGDHEQLAFLGLSGTVSLPICPNCATMSEKTIVRHAPDGSTKMEIVGAFGDESYFDADALARLTSGRPALSSEPMPPYFNFCPEDVATIGGRANRVQDPQFEECPDAASCFLSALRVSKSPMTSKPPRPPTFEQ